MQTFNERLAYVLDKKQITASELSRQTGLSRAIISLYVSGKSIATASSALIICEKLNLSYDWLKLGEGSIDDKYDYTKPYEETYGKDDTRTTPARIKIKKTHSGEAEFTFKGEVEFKFKLTKRDIEDIIFQMLR